MREGVYPNEVGMLEVFHGGEMIARMRSEAEAWTCYNIAHARTTGEIHTLNSLDEITCKEPEA
jgi:hypothetical protein